MRDETAGGTGERAEGYVKWFDEVRGFGFIGREGAADLFVHRSAVEATEGEEAAEGEESPAALRRGERVTFEVAEGPRGLQARAVRRS